MTHSVSWLLGSVITVSISGVLVMVSSELVVLLIVCVGINTGSALGEILKSAWGDHILKMVNYCNNIRTAMW